jgi:5,6-dimethylbenzimidazole synthase
MGWVSLFEPADLAALLGMPEGAEPIAVLCLGPVPQFPDRPELEIVGWTTARPLDELVYTDTWPTD